MIKTILEALRKPSARSIAQREIEEAQRELLAAQSAAEYAASMARYHADRIRRLGAYLNQPSEA